MLRVSYSIWLGTHISDLPSMAGSTDSLGAKSDKGKKKDPVDLCQIAKAWEREEAVRTHLKDKEGTRALFEEHITECVKHCCFPHIHAVLKVTLQRVARVDGFPQPAVDPLREELGNLYKACSRTVIEKEVVNDSWMLRNLLRFIKMKSRISKVSTASCLTC